MAAQPTTATLLTADDLLAMPDDGYRYELVRGELVQLPMSSYRSTTIAAKLIFALGGHVYPRGLGQLSSSDGAFILERDPYTVRIPDVSFVRADRVPPDEAWEKFPDLAPDLAIEVVSPSDRASDVQAKVNQYLDAGVRLIWVVHPIQRSVMVYTPDHSDLLREGDTLDGGDVLPGFQLRVADIFE